MLKRLTNIAVVVCALLIATSAATPSPQEAQEKRPKDQAEYELINKTFKETDPATKLQLLAEWQEKYPESDYKDDRLRLFMRTHQQSGDKEKTLAAAKDVLAKFPGDFEANFTIANLVPTLGKTDAATFEDGVAASDIAARGQAVDADRRAVEPGEEPSLGLGSPNPRLGPHAKEGEREG